MTLSDLVKRDARGPFSPADLHNCARVVSPIGSPNLVERVGETPHHAKGRVPGVPKTFWEPRSTVQTVRHTATKFSMVSYVGRGRVSSGQPGPNSGGWGPASPFLDMRAHCTRRKKQQSNFAW